MARGKKTGGRNLEPGHNFGGRPKLTEIEKTSRIAARIDIAEYWPEICALTKIDDLKKIIKDSTSPMVKKAMASAMLFAIRDGNLSELHRFYDRLLGKPKEFIQQTTFNLEGAMVTLEVAANPNETKREKELN